MNTKMKKPIRSKMKAYRISYIGDDYYVAALNEMQAIGTLAAHIDGEEMNCGPVKEVNPSKIVVHFEKDRGGYEKGSLADIMPTSGDPEVLFDPDYP